MKSYYLIIFAGANGVGKTTVSKEFLKNKKDYYFLNADEIAKEISPDDITAVRLSAGKTAINKLDGLIENKKNIAFESTLSSRSYVVKKIEKAKKKEYKIIIVYTFIDNPALCIERIKDRVKKGGHYVPDEDVKRRFARSLYNFWNIYREMADEWFLYYNMEKPLQVANGAGIKVKVSSSSKNLYDNFLKAVSNDKGN
ncbi:MAG: zeta toxin family protein [Elusimicrobia bacterium]|nr:zeta toxin family protein [Elusimicrobiota bacterium]